MANNIDFNLILKSGKFKSAIASASQSVNKLSDKFNNVRRKSTSSFDKIGSSISLLKTPILMASGAAAVLALTLGGIAVKGVAAANKQENALNSLNAALQRSGEFTPELSKNLQAFASNLQKTTTVGDETAIQMLALASSFGASADTAQEVVTAAANLSAATGKTLEESVRQISKTLGGFAGELGEVNPAIKALTAEQLKAGEAAKILNQQYKGAAASTIQTFSGKLTQLSNAFGDLQESIGFTVTSSPVFRAALEGLQQLIERFTGIISNNQSAIQNLFLPALSAFFKAIQLTENLFHGFQMTVNAIKLGVTQDIIDIARRIQNLQSLINKIPGVDIELISEDSIKRFEIAEGKFSEKLSRSVDKYVEANDIYDGIIKKLDDASKRGPIQIGQQSGGAAQGAPVAVKEAKQAGEAFGKGFTPTYKKFIDELDKNQSQFIKEEARADKEARKKDASQMQNAALSAANSVASAFRQGGAAGAQSLIVGLASSLGQLAGPFGQFIGPAIDLLTTDGAEKLVSGVIDNIPKIVETLAENLPIIATRLSVLMASPAFQVRIIKAFVTGFATGLKEAAGDITSKWSSEFVGKVGPVGKKIADNFASGAERYASNFANALARQWDNVMPDLKLPSLDINIPEPEWVKNLRKGFSNSGNAISKGVKNVFGKFAEGGPVPAGYPNDTFIAGLTSGEMVLTADDRRYQSRKLNAILKAVSGQGGTDGALLSKLDTLIALMSGGGGGNQPLEATIMIDGSFIEKKILQANRNNRRLG